MSRQKIKRRSRSSTLPGNLPVTLTDNKTGEQRSFTLEQLVGTIAKLEDMNRNLVATVEQVLEDHENRLTSLEKVKGD